MRREALCCRRREQPRLCQRRTDHRQLTARHDHQRGRDQPQQDARAGSRPPSVPPRAHDERGGAFFALVRFIRRGVAHALCLPPGADIAPGLSRRQRSIVATLLNDQALSHMSVPNRRGSPMGVSSVNSRISNAAAPVGRGGTTERAGGVARGATPSIFCLEAFGSVRPPALHERGFRGISSLTPLRSVQSGIPRSPCAPILWPSGTDRAFKAKKRGGGS